MAAVNTYDEMTVREAAARLYGFRDDDSSFQMTLATLLQGYALEDGVSSGNYLVDGGGVVWEQDYDYTVSASTYVIQGVQYTAPETPVTLTAADATNDRIDIIAVDTAGDVIVLTGTPASNPQAPDVDPDTQLQLTFVLVTALSTDPGVNTTVLYRENAGTPTEWNYTDNSANLTGADTTEPFAGTTDIAGTACDNGNQFVLTAADHVDLSQENFLSLRVRPNGTWPATKSLRLVWRSSGVLVGNVITLSNGAYGLNTASATYQTIAIPIADFGVGITAVDSLRVRVQGSGAALSFYVDNIELQSGISVPEADGVTSVNGDAGPAVSLNGGYIGVKGADIASAGTTDLATATGDWVDITGTTTITAFGTVAAGVEKLLRFTGILTLTHHATSLILPTGANITTAAGDTARMRSLGSGNWVCVSYQRKDGTALVGSGSGDVTAAANIDDHTIVRGDGGAKGVQESGVTLGDGNEISGYAAEVNAQTGTTYTLQASDAGKIVSLNNAAAITLTLPNSLGAKFVCGLYQKGAGQVSLSGAVGSTINNRSGHSKSAGQHAMMNLYVDSNSGGSSAVYVFSGDTST
jgi:hypothetical protein